MKDEQSLALRSIAATSTKTLPQISKINCLQYSFFRKTRSLTFHRSHSIKLAARSVIFLLTDNFLKALASSYCTQSSGREALFVTREADSQQHYYLQVFRYLEEIANLAFAEAVDPASTESLACCSMHHVLHRYGCVDDVPFGRFPLVATSYNHDRRLFQKLLRTSLLTRLSFSLDQ